MFFIDQIFAVFFCRKNGVVMHKKNEDTLQSVCSLSGCSSRCYLVGVKADMACMLTTPSPF